jgi:hypothetical protein
VPEPDNLECLLVNFFIHRGLEIVHNRHGIMYWFERIEGVGIVP